MMMRKKSLLIWLVALLLLLTGAIIAYNNLAKNKEESNSTSPSHQVEKKVQVDDFTLHNLENQPVSLSDYKGKVVIINFWASYCPPCKSEMPELNQLNQNLNATDDAVLLTINLADGQKETKEKAKAFLDENNYHLNVLFDEDLTVSSKFDVYYIPTTVIIDKKGYLHAVIDGATTEKEIMKYVNEVK